MSYYVQLDEIDHDVDGVATHHHIADRHLPRNGPTGEMTLCGKAFLYSKHRGAEAGAPWCATCMALDC